MKLVTSEIFKSINTVGTDMIVVEGELLKKTQTVILSIAEDIIQVCEENNICYFMGGGSALGAIRHKGMIPWDDDFDINMPRNDYERFISLFKKKYGNKYWIHTPSGTENYGLLYTRIRLKNTVFRGRDDFQNKECGVMVDIFIVENTYNNIILRKIHGIVSLALGFIVSCRKFYENEEFIDKIISDKEGAKRIIKIKVMIGRLFGFYSLDRLVHIADKWHQKCKDSNSEFVTVPTGRNHFFGELYKRHGFCSIKKVEFEGHMWAVSEKVEEYLTHMYGNYMEVPSVERREKHALLELEL